jgi:creatinine amidohydrolase
VEVDTNLEIPEIHGGKNETSMMLAIAPQLVRRDQIAQLKNAPGGETVRQTILDQAVSWPWTTDDKQISDIGVIGDASGASAEFGERILAHVVEMAGGVLKQLADRQRLICR